MTQALYRRWRPQRWDEVVGQDHVIETLRHAVAGERVAHAYLFAGPRGTGKTTTARLLAKAVNCLAESPAERPCGVCEHCVALAEGRFLDLIEIDAASNTSVEDVRDLRDKINFSPNEGRYKVYIVDEVHMLSTAAFNALLKTLEEPPPHAIFILATTEVHKVPATVLSRCQRHEFRRLPVASIVAYLKERAQAEGLQVEPDALELIARQATGSLRDAVSLLDQLTSTGRAVDLELAQSVFGTAGGEAVEGVVQSLIDRDAGAGLSLLNQALDGGADPRQFARQIVDHLRGVLLVRMGNASLTEATAEARAVMAHQAEGLALDDLLAAIDAFSRAAHAGSAGWQPGLPLEMALLEIAGRERSTRGELRNETQSPGANKGSPPGRKPEQEGHGEEGAPSEPAPPQPPGSAALSFQNVMDRWRDVLAAAYRRNPRTQALLNSCTPLGMEGGVLLLGFASDLLREKMEKGDNLEVVRQALSDVIGAPVEVRCLLASGRHSPAVKGDPAPPMEDGGMVATALRELGARVVDYSRVPPDSEE